MNFSELKSTNCNQYIEKKGQFSYLSWPYMVEKLRIHEPDATIHARTNSTGLPYFRDESGAMVETYILLDEKEVWNEWLPVMNFKNQAITNPNAMDINKAIQRCKAKCISEFTGIGLYIYMGEDLPSEDPKPITEKQASNITDMVNATGTDESAFLKWAGCDCVENMQISRYNQAISLLKAKVNK